MIIFRPDQFKPVCRLNHHLRVNPVRHIRVFLANIQMHKRAKYLEVIQKQRRTLFDKG